MERPEILDALESMNEHTQIKIIIKSANFFISIRKSKIPKNLKRTKMLIGFNCLHSASIQSFVIKKDNNVKLTTRFLSRKTLMFAKLSSISFIYKLVETFLFSHDIVKKIYQKYLIEKVYIYHVLTDTDSTCLKFVFVSSTDSDIPDKKFRDIIFEIIVASKIYNRFDSSNVYWEKFGARKENLRRCLGYFEIEHIDNPCFATLW